MSHAYKILTLVMFCISSAGAQSATDIKLPVVFDFGSSDGMIADLAIPVHENNFYTRDKGFGLINSKCTTYMEDRESILYDNLIRDGITSREEISFRVDLPPGEYVLELFMAGGRYNEWRGEITVNDSLVTNKLQANSTSFEGEDPPPYWTLMWKSRVNRTPLLLKVSSQNQPVIITGLRILRYNPGLLYLAGKQVRTSRPLTLPNGTLILRLINSGRISEVQRILDPVPDELFAFEKASLIMALAGRLEVENPRPLLEWAASIFRGIAAKENSDEVQLNLRFIEVLLAGDQYYKLAGWDWAKSLTRTSIFSHVDLAGLAFKKISDHSWHPLALQARFQLARAAYWSWVEQHHPPMRQMADSLFNVLLEYYPDNKLVRMYSGEKIASQDMAFDQDQGIPAWVFYSTRALKNIRETIHYWVDNRQADNGEFGGKFDDDVEMLRWWPIARLAINDEKTLLGLQRLVDGIWQSGWITEGFSTKVRDVEHSSEPVADTQPMMIGLDYGNPVYVENCMQSIKGLKELWTGINAKGHRHFKSSWYSYNDIDTEPPKDCDVPMNTRTIKAARWLAWYNRHPFAVQFLKEWGDAWLEDCMRTDKGKPYGIVPSAIRYHDDAIGGHADNWHHPGLFWSYYDFNGGASMLQQFMVVYDLTGDKKYLEPIELAMKLVRKYDGEDLSDAQVGSEEWVVTKLRNSDGFAETMEQWRLLTGNPEYDQLLKKYGSDYLKFYLTGEFRYIEQGSRNVLEGIVYNHELITTEGYFTDRIDIGNHHDRIVLGAGHLESIYTGSSLFDGFYPFYPVTWTHFNPDFAAVVISADHSNLTLSAFNLSNEEQKGEIVFWRLSPGTYEISMGTDVDKDNVADNIQYRSQFTISSRSASIPVSFAPGMGHIVSVKQILAAETSGSVTLTDIGLSRNDIRFSPETEDRPAQLVVPVHNIGINEVENIQIDIRYKLHDGQKIVLSRNIEKLAAPLDLNASIHEVAFDLSGSDTIQGEINIILDPENKFDEITKINNWQNYKISD